MPVKLEAKRTVNPLARQGRLAHLVGRLEARAVQRGEVRAEPVRRREITKGDRQGQQVALASVELELQVEVPRQGLQGAEWEAPAPSQEPQVLKRGKAGNQAVGIALELLEQAVRIHWCAITHRAPLPTQPPLVSGNGAIAAPGEFLAPMGLSVAVNTAISTFLVTLLNGTQSIGIQIASGPLVLHLKTVWKEVFSCRGGNYIDVPDRALLCVFLPIDSRRLFFKKEEEGALS